MTERKDLVSQDYGWFEVYDKEEADQVMDSLEARIKELEATISKMETTGWVSVKDRLPLNDGTMLVCDANNDLFALIGRDPNGVLKQLDDRPTVVATHWMPLPPPPTKEGM